MQTRQGSVYLHNGNYFPRYAMAVFRRDIHMKVNYFDTLYQLVYIAGKV